jgi:hypothetical protein
LGASWKLRRGRQDVVVGSGLEVVLFLKKLAREETLIRMWDNEPVTVLKAISRVNCATALIGRARHELPRSCAT